MSFAINEEDIKARVGSRSFQRGKAYYRNGSIRYPKWQEETLKAQCEGSYDNTYQVSVTFDGSVIDSAYCSCPVGDGGYCKHVAALLLTWLHQSDRFTQMQPLDDSLAHLSKEELILLIKQMIRLSPELEEMVAVPKKTAVSATTTTQGISIAFITQQMQQIIKHAHRDDDDYYEQHWHHDDEYSACYEIAQQAKELIIVGEDELANGRWLAASQIFISISNALMTYEPNYDYDDSTYIDNEVETCQKQLLICLEASDLTASEPRQIIIQQLVNIYEYGVGEDVGLTIPDDLVATITEAERQALISQIRSVYQQAQEYSKQAYGYFRLTLEEADLDDEAYIALCKEADLPYKLIPKYLEQGQLRKALSVVRPMPNTHFLAYVSMIVESGFGDDVLPMVQARLKTASEQDHNLRYRLLTWLQAYVEEKRDWALAQEYAEQFFQMSPSVEKWQKLKTFANKNNSWVEARQNSIQWLLKEENHTLLTEIYLHEGEHDAAVRSLHNVENRQKRYSAHYFGYHSVIGLQANVAEVVQKTHPQESIRIYKNQAERLIAQRGRGNYAEAARLLVQLKSVYVDVLQDTKGWLAYIAQLRQDNKTLRAMQDEFNKAKL